MSDTDSVEGRLATLLGRSGVESTPAGGLAGLLAGLSGELSQAQRDEVEGEVLSSMLRSYDCFVDLLPEVHEHWPGAFMAPSLRSAMHLALEVDRFGVSELCGVLEVMLSSDERFDELIVRPDRLTLLGRQRLACLCGAIAVAERSQEVRSLLCPERADVFERVLVRLFDDRDPNVGLRAAWAVGVRLSTPGGSPLLSELVERQLESVARGRHARRALAARTAIYIFDADSEERFLEELFEGVGKRDQSARAVAIRALQFGMPAAPHLTAGLVEQLVEGGSTRVLAAAAGLALAMKHPTRTAALLEKVSQAADQLQSGADPSLRFLIGPRSPLAETLFNDLLALRRAACESPAQAASVSGAVLSRLATSGHEGVARDVEEAHEALLFDTTLLRDAILVGAGEREERRARFRSYADVLAAARRRRLALLQLEERDRQVRRSRLWWLTRAFDASPRVDRQPRRDAGNIRAELIEAALQAVAQLSRFAASEERIPMLDRPAAIALMTSIEIATRARALSWTDAVAALWAMRSGRMLEHCDASTTSSELAPVIHALVSFRTTLELLERAQARARQPLSLTAGVKPLRNAARSLSLATKRLLPEQDDPVRIATLAIVRAIDEHCRVVKGGKAAPVLLQWSAVLEAFSAIGQRAKGRFDLATWERCDSAEATLLARSLVAHAGLRLDTEHEQQDYGIKRARRVARRALPNGIAGLFDVLLAFSLPSPESSPPLSSCPYPTGRRIGDYVVLKPLGEGGMGWCLLVARRLEASHPRPRHFVLKLPRDASASRQFREEAKTLIELSKSSSAAIVRFMGFIDYGFRLPFLLMEYVDGETLDQYIKRSAGLPLQEVLQIGSVIAGALAKCHANQVSHQDLKPDNIILASSDPSRPVLVDWGLAGAGAVRMAGTFAYMAPERWQAEGPALPGAPSDIFALACLLYEAKSGQKLLSPPVSAEDFSDDPGYSDALNSMDPRLREQLVPSALARNHRALEARIKRSFGDAPALLVLLLLAMLGDDPDARPSAAGIAAQLSELLESS